MSPTDCRIDGSATGRGPLLQRLLRLGGPAALLSFLILGAGSLRSRQQDNPHDALETLDRWIIAEVGLFQADGEQYSVRLFHQQGKVGVGAIPQDLAAFFPFGVRHRQAIFRPVQDEPGSNLASVTLATERFHYLPDRRIGLDHRREVNAGRLSNAGRSFRSRWLPNRSGPWRMSGSNTGGALAGSTCPAGFQRLEPKMASRPAPNIPGLGPAAS